MRAFAFTCGLLAGTTETGYGLRSGPLWLDAFSAEKYISIATEGHLAEVAPLTPRRHIGGSNVGL